MRTWNGIASHLLRLAESKHRTVNRAAEAWGVGDAPWKTSAGNDYNPLSHCQCWATEQNRSNMPHPHRRAEGRAGVRTQSRWIPSWLWGGGSRNASQRARLATLGLTNQVPHTLPLPRPWLGFIGRLAGPVLETHWRRMGRHPTYKLLDRRIDGAGAWRA